MEQGVKVGDRIKIIKPWVTQGRYEKGDVLTVRSVSYAGVWVVENGWYIDENEFEVITDEIKPGDTVTLIDKPWEWDGWAQLDRKRRCAYGKMTGKEITVCNIYQSPALVELRGIPCANTGVWFIPLAILRKVEPVKVPFDYEPEPVEPEPKRDKASTSVFEAGKQYVFSKDLHREASGDCWNWVKQVEDGAPVNFRPGTNFGMAGGFAVLAAWCREVPAKHRYTDEQITEAKCYLAEKMFDNTGRIITKPTEAHPVAVVIGGLGTGTAKCAPDDEFNAYIGLMVAFKRYHGEPLPTWIRG